MIEVGKEINENTCCLCLSEEESTFHSDSVLKSLPLREMVSFCMGVQLSNIADSEQTISSSICSECVLNISNYYTFKKKIIRAQILLGSMVVDDGTDEQTTENENELQIATKAKSNETLQQMFFEDHLRSPDFIEIEELINDEEPQQSTTQTVDPLPTKSENQIKRGRPSETTAKTPNKRSKNATDDADRVTIQMNECLICPAILDDILQLDDHISSHKVISCKVCRRTFARYSNLKRHFMAAHSKPKPFQCDLCGLGFSFSVNLQAHAALHYSGKIRMK